MAQLTPEQTAVLIGGVAVLAWLIARSSQAAPATPSGVLGVPVPRGTSGSTPVYTYTDPIPTPLQRALPASLDALSLADRNDVLRVLQAQLALLGFPQPDVYAAGDAFLMAARYNQPLGQTQGQYLAWLAGKVDETVRAAHGLAAPTGRY